MQKTIDEGQKMETQKLFDRVVEAANSLKGKITEAPTVGVILGTGLGDVSKRAKERVEIPYSEIPGFSESTVESHQGTMSFGKLGKQSVVFMEGRFHFYEGYSLDQVTLPVRVMKELGVKTLFVTNAAGGMNPQYNKGDIVIITDHINFMGVNPLVGKNDPRLGPRFPDMIEPYSNELIALAEKVALEAKIPIKKGVYIGVTGPCLETRAEYRMMRQMGADLVGMSTVPEVIVAIHAGLKVFGMSCATDLCLPDALEPVDIDDIIATAKRTGPLMDQLIEKMIQKLDNK